MVEHNKQKPIIHVNDLWKKYGSLHVLRGVFLDVYEGETVVILGRSGVGKSVLLRQIIGLEKPDTGFVEVDGLKMDRLSSQQRNDLVSRMGMLFQGSALFDSLTIKENIAFHLRQHQQLEEKEINRQVTYALEMVGLQKTEDKMPSELSGGMRKRAALARLIVYRPKIILYDEPTTGLDPMTAMQINDIINETKKELKATSVVVTHDIRSALEIGDRLAFHHDGKIAHIAAKKDFFNINDPNIQSFYQNALAQK